MYPIVGKLGPEDNKNNYLNKMTLLSTILEPLKIRQGLKKLELSQAQCSLSYLQTSLELTGLITTYLATCDCGCSILWQFLTTKILLELIEK